MDREELRRQLLATFKVELDEHLATMNKGLLEIEKDVPPEEREELLKELFRAAHSIKGSARAVELKDIETVSHKMEDLFGALKKGTLCPSPDMVDRLLQACDVLGQALDLYLEGSELSYDDRMEITGLLDAVLEERGEEGMGDAETRGRGDVRGAGEGETRGRGEGRGAEDTETGGEEGVGDAGTRGRGGAEARRGERKKDAASGPEGPTPRRGTRTLIWRGLRAGVRIER